MTWQVCIIIVSSTWAVVALLCALLDAARDSYTETTETIRKEEPPKS